ncbi:hypothetical protein [Olleya sp. HaHaR_3_96]|uniref:hypothetical protein n=1 Tax=Olleya sp. HaHaR_3_96 TaxID=2745560 RepID=UPI001C4FF4BE|nr:hypothetical protein [Olleya sp. HaHaR_3_96]QXP60831.1 hypothetical protein H0I26_04110 [Olleya sp. HaHaR_3_96]
MDSEITKIYSSIGVAMTGIALLILNFSSPSYTTVCFVLFFIIGGILSVLGGALLRWGKSYNLSSLITCLLMFALGPFIIAYLTNRYIIAPLLSRGLLTSINTLLFLGSIALVYIYIKYYEQYHWKPFYLQEDQQLEVDIISIALLNTKPYVYETGFMSKSHLFNNNRINDKKKYWERRDYLRTGLPNGLELVYFSAKEQQLYRGLFKFSKQSIRRYMGWGLFYPLTRSQNYDTINLILFSKGAISLQLGTWDKDITFFDGVCTPITTKDLSTQELKTLAVEKIVINPKPSPPQTDTSDSLAVIRKQKLQIKHSITGLTKKINSISVITTNGDRYVLHKKYWKGKTLPKRQAPIAMITLIIVNNKGQNLSWEYVYNIADIASHFNTNSTKVTTLDYKFDLFNTTDDLLRASSFEYINGVKNELKLERSYIKIIA